MWFQSPPPLTNRWVLHVAATTAQASAVLRELRIDDQQPRYNGDEQFPVYLRGAGSPYGPPEWMAFARAELNRRGYATRWCTAECRHHPWPPRIEPTPSTATATPTAAARERGRKSVAPAGPRTPLRRITSGAPHHRPSLPVPAERSVTT